MKRANWFVFLLINFLVFTGFLTYSVWEKEKIRKTGRLVFLPLVPKDPRSLFQGDYMILNYDWERLETEESANAPKRGCMVFRIENEEFIPVRLQENFTNLSLGEHCLKYYRSEFQLKIGAESYFFQEGDAGLFSEAKYAGIRFKERDNNGDKLLVGLYDKNKQLLGEIETLRIPKSKK
ncbi:GDYXXLXY domain-containing protein [Leptospira meyeri]|uniref:GDYXXLXY domain-containing protein n=1 Tax=Leptospira meyeri TaxID=29508 RepID=UPI000C2ACC24|nr:GDYXXLXY domain-containing protein [Leptospira meyeri]PJZ79465.1 GDYXXLXY protein [Leptospira meyeri]PJZ98585.1 GDYXXLXY protein [Leptospira meyeri]PKA14164.1 GDYXXLXY protein [Leptospira meyeri]PKA27008.1 GDYXXLXY protein [Leptospira sp. mixed culture ATI2-C-A1]